MRIPPAVRLAFFWNKHSPRARSALPRLIGRHLVRKRQVFIKTAAGAKLSVDLHNLDTYATIYNQGGRWDAPLMRACQTLLRDHDVFYDIGSNTGIFAIDTAFQFASIRTYAFEPQANQADAILQSIGANDLKNVTCLRCMLGKDDGTGELYLTSHSIHASSIPREGKFKKVKIPMHSIDSLLKRAVVEGPDVVKIDVEGGEMAVFEGAKETFSKFRPSIIFEADENLRRFGIEPNALIETISSFGEYRFFEIDKDGSLRSIRRIESEGNFLALSGRHFKRLAPKSP
jgi:FkbM family methyltransferase